jgi:class 3 adenylate cyclase/streptogramin lyase
MTRSSGPGRVLATVLFTDIVGSTELAATLGDRRWRELQARHHRTVRSVLRRHGGREVDTAGDGLFATFDQPARAIDAALGMHASLAPLGIGIRAGIHTGEVERRGREVGGIAVHIGARVMAAATTGETLVTATVRQLVTGAEFVFADHGPTTLKGVEGEWHLYAVSGPPDQVAPPAGTSAEGRRRVAWSWPIIAVGGVVTVAVLGAALLLPRALAGPVIPAVDEVGRLPAGGTSFDLAVGVGQRPTGIAVADGVVWISNAADETLSTIDASSGERIADPAIGGRPTGIAVGGGSAWVTTAFGLASGEAGSIVRFDRQYRVADRIDVGSGVGAIAYGAGVLWVADRLADAVVRVVPETGSLDPPIAVGRAPNAVAVGAGGIWVTSQLDRTVWRVDPDTAAATPIAIVGAPSAVAAEDAAVWVTSEVDDSVTRLDPTTSSVVTSLTGLDGARGIALAPDGIWVALSGSRELVRIDRQTTEITARQAVGGVPDGVAVDEAGAVWVTVREP